MGCSNSGPVGRAAVKEKSPSQSPTQKGSSAPAYPPIIKKDISYNMHGDTIPDPFQYLEDPDSKETKEFVKGQNRFFRTHFPIKAPERKKIKTLLQQSSHQNTSVPFPYNGKYYYYYNPGLDNQPRYLRANALNDNTQEEFLNLNRRDPNGTSAIAVDSWSKSGTLYAFGVQEKGSDWVKIYVKNADHNDRLSDVVNWVRFSNISWLGDEGFFYTRYPDSTESADTAKAQNATVYYHRIGTLQGEDVCVLSGLPSADFLPTAEVSDCGRFLVVTIHDGCCPHTLIWIAWIPPEFWEEPQNDALDFVKLINEFDAEYSFIGNDDDLFYFVTTKDAPMRKVISVLLPEGETAVVVPQRASAVLSDVRIVQDTLILQYLEDVKDVLYTRSLYFDPHYNPPLPRRVEGLPVGSVSQLTTRRDVPFVSFKVTSFFIPGKIFVVHDIERFIPQLFREDFCPGIEADNFAVQQVFVASETDSEVANIPMFILYRKDLDLVHPQPTILYGYGGFNIPLKPHFDPLIAVFINEMHGIYCVANIRGGGERGQTWYDAGRLEYKENCFRDFISCARFLNAQPFCTPSHLVIRGGSNGGMLVAACANMAPEEFAGVIAHVGVMDLFRFHKFTIGYAWRSDYGDPDEEFHYHYLRRYSPIHNIVPGMRYPQVLALTGDHDDRVVPMHSLKYIATLQTTAVGGPFYARIDVAAGHGFGKPVSKKIDEGADVLVFVAEVTQIKMNDNIPISNFDGTRSYTKTPSR